MQCLRPSNKCVLHYTTTAWETMTNDIYCTISETLEMKSHKCRNCSHLEVGANPCTYFNSPGHEGDQLEQSSTHVTSDLAVSRSCVPSAATVSRATATSQATQPTALLLTAKCSPLLPRSLLIFKDTTVNYFKGRLA